jgi:hypothetical protein
MECLKKRGIQTGLNIVVDEIYSGLRQELMIMACSKIGVLKLVSFVIILV